MRSGGNNCYDLLERTDAQNEKVNLGGALDFFILLNTIFMLLTVFYKSSKKFTRLMLNIHSMFRKSLVNDLRYFVFLI